MARPRLTPSERAWRTLLAYAHYLPALQWLRFVTRLYGVKHAEERISHVLDLPARLRRQGLGRLARAIGGATPPHVIALDQIARLQRVRPRTVRRRLTLGRRLWPGLEATVREQTLSHCLLRTAQALHPHRPPTKLEEARLDELHSLLQRPPTSTIGRSVHT